MGFLLCLVPVIIMASQQGGANPAPGGARMLGAFAFYVVFGLAAFAVGGVRIFAGIRNYSFRGHTLGIISFALGLVTLITCYCAPTSIALGIYGLIIYLNPDVSAAFARRERGETPEQITASFSLPR